MLDQDTSHLPPRVHDMIIRLFEPMKQEDLKFPNFQKKVRRYQLDHIADERLRLENPPLSLPKEPVPSSMFAATQPTLDKKITKFKSQ
jgi:hypothetical protein